MAVPDHEAHIEQITEAQSAEVASPRISIREETEVRAIPDDQFKKLMMKSGEEHHGLFKKLAQ